MKKLLTILVVVLLTGYSSYCAYVQGYPGEIIAFAGSTCPAGTIAADGTTF